MAYIKQAWEDGVTPINAEHMNYIEEGVEWAAKAAEEAAAAIPANTSQLTNDSGFITKAVSDLENYLLKSETYTREEVQELLNTIPKFSIEVVDALPEENISATTVYLVRDGEDGNLYTEYIYANGAWEMLGTQCVDLTDYLKKDDVSALAISGDWSDMLNKPFGESVQIEEEIIPVATRTANNIGTIVYDGSGIYFGERPNLASWNGKIYPVKRRGNNPDETDYDVYGNGAIINPDAFEDTGEPFAINVYLGEAITSVHSNLSEGETVKFGLFYGYNNINPLDDQFIPSTVPVIQSAAVGQTVVVKAVDDEGKPTEWEAVEAVKSWDDLEGKPFGEEISNRIEVEDSATYSETNTRYDFSFGREGYIELKSGMDCDVYLEINGETVLDHKYTVNESNKIVAESGVNFTVYTIENNTAYGRYNLYFSDGTYWENKEVVLRFSAHTGVESTLDPKFLPPLTSPNGTKYKLTVADDGALSATAVT